LSTIRKADNIIVMREGRKIEEGTHEQLLSTPDGLYAGLVHAQQLEAESAPEVPKEGDTILEEELSPELTNDPEEAPVDKPKVEQKRGFFRSVGTLLYEQRRYWMFYVGLVAAAMAIGSK
jgi:ATP-binding cassette, subfamily B (MDR/TAP), member 1